MKPQKKKIATCKKILKVLKMVNYISLEHKRNTNIAVYMYTGISQNRIYKYINAIIH